MKEIEINIEPVELYKILKFENLAASGGEAKHIIAEGHVSVNGEPKYRKRRKIFSGDVIKLEGEEFMAKLKAT